MEDRARILEERIEYLTRELADTINDADVPGRPGIRSELRDFAIGLLQDSVAPVEVVPPSVPEAGGGPLNPIGIAIPLFFAGAILFFLFPPVGLLLLAGAAVMVLWGLLVSVVRRRA